MCESSGMRIVESEEFIDVYKEISELRDAVNDSILLDDIINMVGRDELTEIVKQLVVRYKVNSPLHPNYKKPEKDIPVKAYDIEYFYDNSSLPSELELKVTFNPEVHDDFDDAVEDALDDYLYYHDKGNFVKSYRYSRK